MPERDEVAAAIHRTRIRTARWVIADAPETLSADAMTLAAEVERLDQEVADANGRARAAEDALERLRAERDAARTIITTALWAKASTLDQLLAEHHIVAQVVAFEGEATYGWIVRDDEPTRDRIRGAAQAVLANASHFPSPAQVHLLGQDMAPLTEKVVDAVWSALTGADDA